MKRPYAAALLFTAGCQVAPPAPQPVPAPVPSPVEAVMPLMYHWVQRVEPLPPVVTYSFTPTICLTGDEGFTADTLGVMMRTSAIGATPGVPVGCVRENDTVYGYAVFNALGRTEMTFALPRTINTRKPAHLTMRFQALATVGSVSVTVRVCESEVYQVEVADAPPTRQHLFDVKAVVSLRPCANKPVTLTLGRHSLLPDDDMPDDLRFLSAQVTVQTQQEKK